MFIKKNLILSAILLSAVTLFGRVSYAQGIPTIDNAAIAQYLQQIEQMKVQIENQVSQIVELKNQVNALTSKDNLKGMGKELSSQRIPDSWKDLYQNIEKISDTDINKVLNPSSVSPKSSEQLLVGYYKQLETNFGEMKKRFTRLTDLQNRLRQAPDIKAAADIQSQIAIENGAVQVDQTKLDNMQRIYDVQKEVIVKQENAIANCQIMAWAKGEPSTNCK